MMFGGRFALAPHLQDAGRCQKTIWGVLTFQLRFCIEFGSIFI